MSIKALLWGGVGKFDLYLNKGLYCVGLPYCIYFLLLMEQITTILVV